MKMFTKTILRGVGQVMFQNNALTGLLFLIGIFYNSLLMGIGAILGNVISTITAYLFKYSRDDIENGLYGYNGTLTGIAIYFYFGFSFISTIGIIFGAFISTIVMCEMKKRIGPLTASFVVSTWLVILLIKLFNLIPLLSSSLEKVGSLNILQAASMGFGQVMFQGSIITGILFFIAIFVNSRKSAIYALYGSILGIFIALILLLSLSMINIGLFGYNAVLCAIALGNDDKKSFLYATIAVILSVIFTYLFGKLGIIALTAPFVISTWIVLLIKYFVDRKITVSQTP